MNRRKTMPCRTKEGYILVYDNNRHVLEHRLVASRMLGRELLSTEKVKHKNGINDDNRPENLEVISKHRPYISQGYVFVWVGLDHPLSDRRGYAQEHRLVVWKSLGRDLNPGEVIHHKNEIKHDNRLENLEVCKSRAHHLVRHRKKNVGW